MKISVLTEVFPGKGRKNLPEERRRFLRVKKTFPLNFNVRGKMEVYEAQTFDISLGGIGFFSPLKLKLKDIIYIRMKIPGFDESMVIRGIVRWKKEFEDGRFFVGVEFFNIEEEEKNIILKALREN